MFVADLNTGEPVFKGKSRKPLLDIVRELPDGEYVVAGTSVDKYSVARVTVPLSQDPNLSYRTDCVSITGSVIGQPAGDHPVGFFPWTDPERIQAVGVEKDGAFAACVPSGRYYAVVEGEQFHSQKLYFDLASGAGAADVKLWALDELNRPASRSAFVNTPDLPEFIDAAAKNASVIGIGESDHGSASALTSRTKLIMSLAALGRVSAIAIEAGPVEVFPLDDYVTGKSVDVKAAVAGLGYWIWNTKEFIDFLKMIRIHNQSGSGDVIRIVGIDLPQNEKAFDYLIEHVGRLGLEDALVAQLAPLRTDRAAGAAALDAKERQSMIDELRVRASRMSGSEAERDRVALLSVAHRIEVSALTGVWRNAQRDVAMADMVLLNAERTEGKVLVVLAHNRHVKVSINNVPPTAGYWIRAKLGDGYRAIGLFGYAGETRARGATSMDVYPLPAPPTYSMESAVASDNPGRAEVYLPFARLSRAARDWLVLPRRVREFGAGYPGPTGDFDYVPLLEEYDAAVVVRLVVPSTDASDVHTAE